MAFVDFQNVTTHKHRVVKKREFTLSEADKLLRNDVYSMIVVPNCNSPCKVNVHFYNDDGYYSFEVNDLLDSDVKYLYKTYPMLYNHVDDLPF